MAGSRQLANKESYRRSARCVTLEPALVGAAGSRPQAGARKRLAGAAKAAWNIAQPGGRKTTPSKRTICARRRWHFLGLTSAFANRLPAAAEEPPTAQWRRLANHHRQHRARAARQWCRWQADAQCRQSRRDRAESSALSGLCGLFRYEHAWRHPPRITPQPAPIIL